MTDSTPELPEELEAAVYEALFEGRTVDGEGDRTLTELCERHPRHAPAIRHLADRVRAGARATGSGFETPAAPPARIGAFTLGKELGRGGFGVVYQAEQDAPLSRTVALKILAPGLDADTVHARFELERQLLARLTHPNIAEIHDAGTTPEGRPWFAMEFIDGPPITHWCQQHHPSIEGTAALFLQACDAVQHAHQRGVIHRDLKPGNVLVTAIDGDPIAKVIDFGVAKAIDQPLPVDSEDTTQAGAIIGTPEYMSPEQGLGEPADVRSDVYSLGALLYRLLTDEAPRDLTTLRERGLAAFRHELTTTDPERPSRRALTSAPQRASRIRGDLDWICLKALHRDPEVRYASVAELATDLRLHLEGRPITARPPSFGYLVATTWRRHKARLAAAGLAALLLLAASVASTLFWIDAREQESIAREQEGLARQRAEQLDAAYAELQRTTDPLLARERAEYAERELWPALPATLPAFDAWLASAHAVKTRLDGFPDDFPEREQLADQIEKVEQRRERAEEIAARSATDREAWQRAITAVATDERYEGLQLEPMPGLLPLGPDPESGLEEFAHLLSGEAPTRRADGGLELEETSGLVLVLVPGATARIGSQSDDPDAPLYDPASNELEQPAHEVSLAPFLISKWEVTQGQWRRMNDGENPSQWHDRIKFRGVFHSLLHPVESVSWEEARRILPRFDLDLPTESAWEYAARAGTTLPWLDLPTKAGFDRLENLADATWGSASAPGVPFEAELDDGFAVHAPVGTFAPNRFGLYDVLGNVFEWTASRMHEYSVPAAAGRGVREAEQIRSANRNQRVFRGGAYKSIPSIARVSRRSIAPEDARSSSLGLRPVRWLVPAPD